MSVTIADSSLISKLKKYLTKAETPLKSMELHLQC